MKRLSRSVLPLLLVLSVVGCADRADRDKTADTREKTKQTVITSDIDTSKEMKAKKESHDANEIALQAADKEKPSVTETGPVFLDRMNASLAGIAEAVKPSVVNISTTKTISMKDHPLGDFLDDPFFKRFFGDKLHPHGGCHRQHRFRPGGSRSRASQLDTVPSVFSRET